jgi:hypothetical protein
MHEELRMAREVQLAMLPQRYPTFPADVSAEFSALRFTHRYQPASEVSGGLLLRRAALGRNGRCVHLRCNGSWGALRACHFNASGDGRNILGGGRRSWEAPHAHESRFESYFARIGEPDVCNGLLPCRRCNREMRALCSGRPSLPAPFATRAWRCRAAWLPEDPFCAIRRKSVAFWFACTIVTSL